MATRFHVLYRDTPNWDGIFEKYMYTNCQKRRVVIINTSLSSLGSITYEKGLLIISNKRWFCEGRKLPFH